MDIPNKPLRLGVVIRVGCILLAVLVVKAFALLVVLPSVSKLFAGAYGLGFADNYDLLASNLLAGNGYRFFPDGAETLMREPGYPLFLAAMFALLGESLTSARIANLILGGITGWLVYRLSMRVWDDRAAGVLASMLFLLHPGVLAAEARGGAESLFMVLVVGFMLAVYRARETGRLQDYAHAGLLLGVTTLVRSTLILFPVFLFAYLVGSDVRTRSVLQAVARIGLLVLVALVVVSPWAIRNYLLVGRMIPTASVQGVSAHSGQYICKHLSFDRGLRVVDREGQRSGSGLRGNRDTGFGRDIISTSFPQGTKWPSTTASGRGCGTSTGNRPDCGWAA